MQAAYKFTTNEISITEYLAEMSAIAIIEDSIKYLKYQPVPDVQAIQVLERLLDVGKSVANGQVD